MPTPRKYPRIKIAGRPGEHVAHLVMSETETISLAGAWSTPEVAFAAAQAELVNEQAARAEASLRSMYAGSDMPSPEPAPVPPVAPAVTAARAKMPKPVPTRCPDCKRRVRRSFEKASSWPGTVVMMDKTGLCGKCKKIRQHQVAVSFSAPPEPAPPAGYFADQLKPERHRPPAVDDLVEELEPEPSKPKSRRQRAAAVKPLPAPAGTRQGTPVRGRQTLCPGCQRPVRPRKATPEEFPGTVQGVRADGTCVRCVRAEATKQENRAAAKAAPQPMLGPPAPFEEPRRSAIVPTPRAKPAPAPPVPKPPPVTVLGSGPITGPMDPYDQTMHALDAFMARRKARGTRPTPHYIDRKARA